jgi:uncharacterized protein (TIGR02680 family)
MQGTFDNFASWASEDSLTHQVAHFVELLQAQPGGPHGYRLRRIVLTNFWLYGRQEFEIPHGRLFLAGENASGKSTVLTAALPLGLDGDLRPNRLDTFGGRERRIEYYVLGGADSATPFNYERRTAYIALEFEWCDPDSPPIAQELRTRWENGDREHARFLTIGLSIAGNTNVTDRIRPLRFLITDGSRLGYDLDTVYETGNKGEKRAYDHLRFKQLLEGRGIICESQAEYERQVARYLFGFSDVKDFEKLINLLLILRRPNLSTELSFSRVHDYLKMSLRKISSETTSRVIGTIERIDAIQSEIERIQQSYDAADRVHRARQRLALVRARLAASEYLAAQSSEDAVHSRVVRLRRDVTRGENERQEAAQLVEALRTEHSQVIGQIKALEASEGLQVATQLTLIRERAQEADAQANMQEQSLKAAQRTVITYSEDLQRQRDNFVRLKEQCVSHARELRTIATEEALWETAAFRLEEVSQQLSTLSEDMPSPPTIPAVVSMLESDADERSAWLHRLEDLHRQREQLEQKLQYARSLETTRFQELDDARRHFQQVQEHVQEAEQKLQTALMPFDPDEVLFPDDLSLLAEEESEDETHSFVERYAAALSEYRRTIERLERGLVESIDQVQGEMNELQLLTGRKMGEIEEITTLYEQKQAEPEYVPPRSSRRVQARSRLAERGIAALPLYTLLDFAPDLPEEEAGRIEYALTDAGLLDALVVPSTQQAAAEKVLASEELSDCLLNMSAFASVRPPDDLRDILRFDPAVLEIPQAVQYSDWQTVAVEVATMLGRSAAVEGMPMAIGSYHLTTDGAWTHGLLNGHAASGVPQCIGKATRLRARQRELDELDGRRVQLTRELQWLTDRLKNYEQQIAQFQERQLQLRRVLPESGLEEVYAALMPAEATLAAARSKYQKARQQTQETRQSCNALTVQLERESQGIAQFVGDAKLVQVALMAVIKLKNQAHSLHNQLTTIISTWHDSGKTRVALERAQQNAGNVALLYERIRQQALQTRAELEELQRVASVTNVEELSTRLQTLRARNEELFNELDEARQKHTRADERYTNTAANLSEAEAILQESRQERQHKQETFLAYLATYPVEELLATQSLQDSREAAQTLLGAVFLANDAIARKETLDAQYRDSYNALSRIFVNEQPTLLEYGPDLDDQGSVQFINEQRSRPIELLGILSDRIGMQRTLLGEEERQLFEDFLLQEIAEAIRTHILEAEEWVQQINNVLSNLPMIGEHYALQWKAPAEYDMTKLGSHLAQHHRLLRKPVQALTDEETETLMNAFRREIESVRLRQQETTDMNFMEALEQVFDYREWFHFDVWVTPIGGQRQRLTDRVAGTRSGAEQLFALYVPLFAALGALYRSAAPGAPRLLALDEAFDKVSTANTQRIIEFLVSQDFQWIMTGPQVSGTGSKIPASARYLMIHDKGTTLATASASFWSDSHDVITE